MGQRSNNTLRNKLYLIIFRADTRPGRLFDTILLWMILLSIFSVILESMASFRRDYIDLIRTAEWFFTIFFTIEYILRIYSTHRPVKYIFSFYGLIDLLSFLPTYLSLFFGGAQFLIVIRAVRLLRVFRILKLTRFLAEGNVLRSAMKASLHKITVFLASVLMLVTIIGTLMYTIEGEEGGFTNIPNSIYWSIVTVTTVGYGDIAPATPLGKILASILMIIGYGIIAVPTGIVSVEMARATDEAKAHCSSCSAPIYPEKARFCSNCGKNVETIET